MSESAGQALERLIAIMRALRAPDGCPWDREQTAASLRPFVLEETYEVLEAIDHGTPADLCEELGDFVFEAVFLSQINEEQGQFAMRDVLDGICDKLIRRHPHVFERAEGAEEGLTSGQVIERWETLKARERALAGRTTTPKHKGTLTGVPKSLPALLRAYELSSRAAAVGFDWAGPGDVLEKLDEEVAEIREAVESGAGGHSSPVEDEVGDLLFAVANLARKLGIEPESALRRANDKFARRFEAVERRVTDQGRSMKDATLAELDAEWNQVKGLEDAARSDVP